VSDDLNALMRAAMETPEDKVPRAIVERLSEPEPEPSALDEIREHIARHKKPGRSL
jgi:hypothetical protein